MPAHRFAPVDRSAPRLLLTRDRVAVLGATAYKEEEDKIPPPPKGPIPTDGC